MDVENSVCSTSLKNVTTVTDEESADMTAVANVQNAAIIVEYFIFD